MIKSLILYLLVFFSFLNASLGAGNCEGYLSNGVKAQDLVRIYAGPGVVIPRAIECIYCGDKSIMPPSLKDPRVTITNTTADIDSLSKLSGGKAPDFKGASIQCTNCGGHSPLWRLGRPGEPPVPYAKTTRLDIFTDNQIGKRYVLLPKEYEELADQNSEMNKLARAQHLAICPSCTVTTNVLSKEAVSCPSCGDTITSKNIYDLSEILNAADKQTKNTVKNSASGPGDTTYSKRNIQPAPTKTYTTAAEIQQGRSALSSYAKKWIAAGVTSIAVLSATTYYMNNTPMIAEGIVTSVSNHVATVRFQETPYFSNDSNLKKYEVQVSLDQRNILPGEASVEIIPGDFVTVHYMWSNFHILPFVFHPYSGAEFNDGSFVEGSKINN